MAGMKMSEHSLYRWSKKNYGRRAVGRPWRSWKIALEVFELKKNGRSDVEIAEHFGWSVQKDDLDKKRLSSTVRRYVKRGREIQSEKNHLLSGHFW